MKDFSALQVPMGNLSKRVVAEPARTRDSGGETENSERKVEKSQGMEGSSAAPAKRSHRNQTELSYF